MGEAGHGDAVRVRDRGRGVLAWQGHRGGGPGSVVEGARAFGAPPQIGSLSERGSWHHESSPARRGLRDGGRGGNRSGHRPLRTLRRGGGGAGRRGHGRADLLGCVGPRTSGGLSRGDRAGRSPYHRSDPLRRPGGGGGGFRGRRGGRHGGRHRGAAVPGGAASIVLRPRSRRVLLPPRHPGALRGRGGGIQDQADAAFRARPDERRHTPRRPALPFRPPPGGGGRVEDRRVHQRAVRPRRPGAGRALPGGGAVRLRRGRAGQGGARPFPHRPRPPRPPPVARAGRTGIGRAGSPARPHRTGGKIRIPARCL